MAKYECRINGHFDEVWQMCTEAIGKGSITASFFKINTVGEEAFLKTLVAAIEERYPLQPGMP